MSSSIYALLFSAWLLVPTSAGFAAPEKRPNILLILVDTLRADHLGAYGYPRPTSPELDAFAQENLVFDYALATTPFTPASVASLFTGVYSSSHGMMFHEGMAVARKQLMRLSDSFDTLAEVLQRTGYTTAAVSTNPWIQDTFAYNQGFEQFVRLEEGKLSTAQSVNSSAAKILDGWKGSEKPFFLYLHYIDPHAPYRPPREYRDIFHGPVAGLGYTGPAAIEIGLYDNEIRYMSYSMGELFNDLKKRGLYEDLVIVFLSDHGEQFSEHGNRRHGFRVYNEEIHVPLIIKTKGKQGRVSTTASLVDVYPTLLSLAGTSSDENLPGVNLLDTHSLTSRSGVLTEVRKRFDNKAFVTPLGRKIMFDFDGLAEPFVDGKLAGRFMGVFDRTIDAREKSPLPAPADADLLTRHFTEALQGALAHQTKPEESDVATPSEETLSRLKSLGYFK